MSRKPFVCVLFFVLLNPFASLGNGKPSNNIGEISGAFLSSKDTNSGKEFNVSGFEAQNSSQSKKVAAVLSEEVQKLVDENPNAKFEIQVRTDSEKVETRHLDYEAYLLAKQIAAKNKSIQISETNQPSSPLLKSSYALKRLHQKAYRLSFALVRGLANASLTTWYLTITPHMSLDAAMTVASVVGAMSFSLQYWSKPIYAWAEKSTGLMGKIFGRYKTKEAAIKERASFWNRAESYGRAYLIEIIYVGILNSAIIALNNQVDIDSYDALRATLAHILITGLWGFTQDTWDLTITEIRNRMEKLKNLSQNKINFRINVSYFSVAGFSMLLLLAQLHKTPGIYIGYITMGIIGGASYLWTWHKSKKLDMRIEKEGLNKVISASPLRDLKCSVILTKL